MLSKFAVSILAAAPFISAWADTPPEGCYNPVRGFAASICANTDCTTQLGIYQIELKRQSPGGNPWLRMSGTFRGTITEQPNECGGITLNHIFMDKDMEGTISTNNDVGCPIGGDGVNTLEIEETLHVAQGTGIYEGLVPGGTITLTGTLGLATGINTFEVTPSPDDEICFDPLP
ncbi:hypothetical protein [Methylohalobius crimeensis]|uniref:hypothetical protein n=1 Tax=Methylohalobius crimeensis TaxID=244365 RepID=UPI001268FAA7|nr:hypothetical protein [Methylohalobius crimeensis]